MFSTTKTSASGLEKYVTGAARSLSPIHYKTAHGYTGGEILYRKSDSTYALAIASASDTAEVLGVVNRSEGTDRFSLTTEGEVTLTVANFQEGTLTGLVDGMVLFLSGSTAGKFTWTEPSTVGYISKPLVKVTSISGGIVKGNFTNMRGTTVGGTNLYTNIPLNNGTATTILNLADDTTFPVGSSGELVGGGIKILQSGANPDYSFAFRLMWTKESSTVVNIQPDALAATPPGFAFGTSGAAITVSFTVLGAFESGECRYTMNAAPLGAQLPLQIAVSRLTPNPGSAFPSAGVIGETVLSYQGTYQNLTSATWFDLNSLQFPSDGLWEVSASFQYNHNTATITGGDHTYGWCQTSGNNSTGRQDGMTFLANNDLASSGGIFSSSIPPVMVTVSGNTLTFKNGTTLTLTNKTIYQKAYLGSFTGGPAQVRGSIQAVRRG